MSVLTMHWMLSDPCMCVSFKMHEEISRAKLWIFFKLAVSYESVCLQNRVKHATGQKGTFKIVSFIFIQIILSKLFLTVFFWVTLGSIWDFDRANYKCKTLNWICCAFYFYLRFAFHFLAWATLIYSQTDKQTEGKHTNKQRRQTADR